MTRIPVFLSACFEIVHVWYKSRLSQYRPRKRFDQNELILSAYQTVLTFECDAEDNRRNCDHCAPRAYRTGVAVGVAVGVGVAGFLQPSLQASITCLHWA
jgi:hypothetical protein